jgi:hypothetical protein
MAVQIRQRLCATAMLALAVLIGVIATAIIVLCHGHLIYSLDDPYISLALSQHIAQGHYGINASEASSPSSSILYPFLLAGFAWTRWQEWVPAAINTLAACATVALIGTELCRLGIITRREQLFPGAVLTVALCVAFNTVGLVFIGLEHSLHVLTSVLVVIGLARVMEEKALPGWLIPAIVLLPLWRFEGLALSGLAILVLAIVRQRRAAVVAALGIGATLGVYMAAMSSLGLPLLPSSVLVKSAVANHTVAGSLGLLMLGQVMVRNAVVSLETKEAWPVFLLIVLVVAHPLLRALHYPKLRGPHQLSLSQETLLATAIAGALLAHVLFGAWGWFGRYEAYAVAMGAVGSIILWKRSIAILLSGGGIAVVAASIVALFCVGNIYVTDTVRTPLASLGIFEQQYQMHRFAVEFYKRPVGVNDIGWVSYRNPNYVLDLWGLGSEAARKARAAGAAGPGWVDRLVEAQHVGLVMIYEKWFAGEIPATWQRIAILESVHHGVSGSGAVVSFYATSGESTPSALVAVKAFSANTDPDTKVTVFAPFAAN